MIHRCERSIGVIHLLLILEKIKFNGINEKLKDIFIREKKT